MSKKRFILPFLVLALGCTPTSMSSTQEGSLTTGDEAASIEEPGDDASGHAAETVTDSVEVAEVSDPADCGMRHGANSRHTPGVCAPYVQVTECPATPEEALALHVDCGLQESVLTCDYVDAEGELTVACHMPWAGCGGGAQMPPQSPRWTQLRAPADFDENGCPQTQEARAARCRAPRRLECVSRCGEVTQCVRRRWQVTRRPPPRP